MGKLNPRHMIIVVVIAFLMATTLGVAVAAHGTIIPIFLDSGTDVPADEECLTFETTGGDIFEWQACGGAGSTPGGSDTQVQFNDGGAFGGDAELTYNKTTDVLSVNNVQAFAETTLIISAPNSIVDGNDGPEVDLLAGNGADSVLDDGGTGGIIIGLAGKGGVGGDGSGSGDGGSVQWVGGDGGNNSGDGAPGDGGGATFDGGDGGTTSGSETGGTGGAALLTGGTGGASIDGDGGEGGGVQLIAGTGGSSSSAANGDGGAVELIAGTAGGVGALDGIINLNGDTYFRDITSGNRNVHQDTDEEVTTTTLTDSGNLVVTLTTGRQYKFKIVVFSLNDGATEGIKLSLAGTATATSVKGQVYIYDDTLNTLVAFARITSLGGAGIGAGLSAGAGYSIIEGTIDVADGGTLLLQFAQNASGASSGIHVEVNSSMEVLAIR